MVGLAVLCAFENGVFHEMGEAVFMCQLIARASFHHQHEVCDFTFFLPVYQFNAVGKCGFVVFRFKVCRGIFQHRVKIGLQRYDN